MKCFAVLSIVLLLVFAVIARPRDNINEKYKDMLQKYYYGKWFIVSSYIAIRVHMPIGHTLVYICTATCGKECTHNLAWQAPLLT